jgi:hypothetical protein
MRSSFLRFTLAFPTALCALVVSSAPAQSVTTTLNGRVFVNHGLVGVGRMPASMKDKYGETFGSFSAFAFQPGSWRRQADGSYAGTLFTQPDRGYNVTGTTNYTPRFNKVAVTFRPAPGGATTQDQVGLTLTDSVLFTEGSGTPFTALDPTATGTGTRAGFPALPQAFNGRLSLDAEGIVVNADGTLWVSDEYGPYVYKFSAEGRLLSAIRPPDALIPKRSGADSFASNNPGAGQPAPSPVDPATGRQNNQGLEGLSLSPDGRTLFALLQSATRQDGGTGGSGPRRHTRLLAYDLTNPAAPSLKGEYVIPLPTYLLGTASRVPAQSEMVALNNTQFLVLARDGNGRGIATPTSLYRSILAYDISTATNIAGTAYDAATPVAPGGVLASGITPAVSTVVVDINDAVQLAKFNLNNGPTDNVNTLSEKWEAMALVPALDPGAPDDWFLFVGNDNDFITTTGFQDGAAYTAGFENDTMVLVYRLTLPGRLINVASRSQTGTGNEAHILGFVVTGARPKSLLIRGVGPTLSSYGVSGALTDPVLAIFDVAGRQLLTNDNWNDSPSAADIRAAALRTGGFALTEGSKDSAIVVTLDPGVYSVQVSANGGGSGVSLVEVYEVP